MDKENIIHPYKEGSPVLCATTKMDLEDTINEINQTQKDRYYVIPPL